MTHLRVALLTAAVAISVQARVISYAPYTDRVATPATQDRMNRHFILFEQNPAAVPAPLIPIPIYNYGQVVVYDSKGLEEPRVVYPQDGSSAPITVVAVREDERQVPTILLQTTSGNASAWMLSGDGGTTWKKLALTSDFFYRFVLPDQGGRFVQARSTPIVIGTAEVPFMVNLRTSGSAALWAIHSDGSVNPLAAATQLLGSDREGRRFVAANYNQATFSSDIFIVDLNGSQTPVTNSIGNPVQGWITPDGGVYLEQQVDGGEAFSYYKGGTTFPIGIEFLAVPTADYTGAWMIDRNPGKPTVLSLHTLPAGLVKQWEDVSGPEVEALHPAASGTRVLIQVHRTRQTIDQLMFKDPALAIWHVGDPAPRSYDELFLSEGNSKGFVHLDVDAAEAGEPFVFDSGMSIVAIPILSGPPGAGGGSDVAQEWGVVRASLAQRLILPSVGRAPGAFNSNWVTDLTLYNPSDAGLIVDLRWVANGTSAVIGGFPPATLRMEPREIRAINDFAKTLYGVDSGIGALFVTPLPGRSINVTSRTYTHAAQGTYGFSMNGIDEFAATSPRFPVTFSGAFQGSNFRTNMTLTDVSGAPASAALLVAGPFGSIATDVTVIDTPAFGQQQVNRIDSILGMSPFTGALVVQPNRGAAIASVFVIDNRTNDPTFFPPDLPASVMRTIPAIGHIDGANGSKFRSDLYLFNHSSQTKVVLLQAKGWDVVESPSPIPLALLPQEARVIPDVLFTLFGRTGVARLRFTIQGSATDTSVRVTSRTYTVDANGGTYGFLMPPLNAFQSGAPGDTLEILGATLDPHFRTNIGLVDLAAFPGAAPSRARVEIVDNKGATIDSFETSVPSAGGMQIDDLFHRRGLPESTTPVLLRVTVIEGMIGAYGAFVDNGTNDPTYAAANLAAR
jgi:hypothetical protein